MSEWSIGDILSRLPPVETTLILCFFTGDYPPQFVAPMDLAPQPPVNCVFDEDFASMRMSVLKLNSAAHDGAVMVGRKSQAEEYRIFGWSHRMFPPDGTRKGAANKGTAYNSCLAMSQIASVDVLYLQSRGQRVVFRLGEPLKPESL
jgi:hypothetical protein